MWLCNADTPALSCLLTVTPRILRAMAERQSEFTTFKRIRIAAGTWNVNGGKQFRSKLLGTAELADWLLDSPKLAGLAGSPGERGGFDRQVQVPGSPGLDLSPQPGTPEIWYLVFSLLRTFRKGCGPSFQNTPGKLLDAFSFPHVWKGCRSGGLSFSRTEVSQCEVLLSSTAFVVRRRMGPLEPRPRRKPGWRPHTFHVAAGLEHPSRPPPRTPLSAHPR